MRTSTPLRPLIGEIKRHEIAVYDLETTTDLERVYLLGFYDGRQYRYFESKPKLPHEAGSPVDQFLLWIFGQTHYRRHRIYAHNGGNFDAFYLVRWLLEHETQYAFSVVPLQSSILSLSIVDKRTKTTWDFLDSFRLMSAKLDSIGKAFGFGGKVENIDYETLHKDERRYEYLERDCRLLHKCLQKFYEIIEFKGGEVAITAPGTAINHFRRVHLDRQVPTHRHFSDCRKDDCSGCVHGFTRRSYYGGRVEVFRESFPSVNDHGSETRSLHLGDINSMYPAAMRGLMPTELVCVRHGDIDLVSYSRHWLGFVECRVSVPNNCYLPPLPYRTETGKLVFPTGTFSGVWAWPELSQLMQVGGRILSTGTSLWFKGQNLFDTFVGDWYSYRDKSHIDYDPTMAQIAKLMLNSLYGKFGITEEREKLWFFPTEEDLTEHELTALADVQQGIFSEKVTIRPAYAIPHVAAWVTSKARARLWSLMSWFLSAGHKIYYCDTDSIVTDGPVLASNELGELKLESTIKRAYFVSPKLYLLERDDGTVKVKAKGFSGGFGAGAMTEDAFWQLVKHRGKVKISRMRKLREGLRNDNQFPMMVVTEKGLRDGELDTKRVHLPGGNTRPLVVNE